ncbi:Smr/MutS family protein [Chitinibacteraceae bacterium HSL-7]
MDDQDKLKSLRKALRIIERERIRKPETPAPPPPPSDHDLFMSAVAGATPIHWDKVAPPKVHVSPWPLQRWADEARVMSDAMSDFWPWDELETGEELLYLRPGMRVDTLKRLRRGEWVIQAELDLHGHTVETARLELATFLLGCAKHKLRCVRIIHGKGLSSKNREPVLKLKLKNWLAQRDEVLAFAQARAVDGGGGAVLVLIKPR